MCHEQIIILGLGNILCGDDGFGVHVAEKLYEKYDFPDNVTIIDGGTRGAVLYQFIEDADKLLIIDAVDFGLQQGQMIYRENEDIPFWLGAKKITAHQNSFAELLALARLKNVMPAQCVLIGIQPYNLEFGTGISSKASIKIAETCELCLTCLKKWGIEPKIAHRQKKLLNNELLQSDFCVAMPGENS